MARLTDMPDGVPVQIFDVGDRVGWKLANKLEDVQLVQFAINKVAPKLGLVDRRKLIHNFGAEFREYAPLAPLVVDGKLGTETANAITSYQADIKFRFGTTPDNVVDPVYTTTAKMGSNRMSNNYIASLSKIRHRTIYLLNKDHLKLFGKIMNANEFPTELRAQINRQR